MRTITGRTHGMLYLEIARRISLDDPEMAKRLTVEDLASLMADSQAVMDATKPGQVGSVDDMVNIVRQKGEIK